MNYYKFAYLSHACLVSKKVILDITTKKYYKVVEFITYHIFSYNVYKQLNRE